MTLIAWQNGKPVFKGGAVAAGPSCCCKKCGGACVKNASCNGGGSGDANCYCVDEVCRECSGPCETNDDCDTPCKCRRGGCVGKCSGPCENTQECSPGCACQFGQCVPCDGCLEPTNCTLTVTITYGDASTETLTYPDQGSLMAFGFGPCSVSAFYGDICGDTEAGTSEIYFKSVELICDDCCGDGSGKNCRLGPVIEEDYHNDCGDQTLQITNFQFALSCGAEQDPCSEFP